MKAIDIATRNHISVDDVLEVCKDLGISCNDGEFDVSDQDVFLIEKKIEVIKTKKAQNIDKMRKGKKIKLKRKVHASQDVKQASGDTVQPGSRPKAARKPGKLTPAEAAKEAAERTTVEEAKKREAAIARRAEAEKKKQQEDKKAKERPKQKAPEKKTAPAKGRPDRPATKKPAETAAGAAPATDDKGRKKDKDKDKDKGRDSRKKYQKKDKYQEKRIDPRRKQAPPVKKEAVTPDEISITENVTVGELAKKLNVKASEVIAKLMKMGEMVTINQSIDADTATLLAEEYSTKVNVVSLYDDTIIKQDQEDRPEDHAERYPVVTVMGHVDHGKTKLLDAIREANVVDSEHGGITQHIGAYQVQVQDKKITFLDTPGHAAFTTMRARGAQVTDIVILVVAANDGVMPQTIEAIDHAKAAGVPIIVAINKIDLEDANLQKVRTELSSYELIPEEWGGTTLFAEISAKQKINIDGLLDLVLIQSEMLELNANSKIFAQGVVIEARLDSGRGPVATLLVQQGVLKVGDPFVVGHFGGRVRAMFNDLGEPIEEAGPSTPVELLGLDGVPGAGDPFEQVASERIAKQISQKRLEYRRIESAKKVRKVTLESLNDMIREGEVQELCIIVKADVDGSAQALAESLEKLSNDEIRVNVIHTATGGINESDVMLASASNAIIIGYHVRPTGRVSEVAERENVSIKFYNIIFEATDDIKAAMEGMLSPDIKEEILGSGEIRQIFKVSKVGTIAGSFLNTGRIRRNSKIRLVREGIVIFDGALASLKRFKDDTSEVEAGQEFGFSLVNYNDVKEGDSFEAYELVEIAKTLD